MTRLSDSFGQPERPRLEAARSDTPHTQSFWREPWKLSKRDNPPRRRGLPAASQANGAATICGLDRELSD
jgi:hypothetical protein